MPLCVESNSCYCVLTHLHSLIVFALSRFLVRWYGGSDCHPRVAARRRRCVTPVIFVRYIVRAIYNN